MRKFVHGWNRDLPDQRDFMLAIPTATVPLTFDMRSFCPPVYDQGQAGSCTGNATAGAIEIDFIQHAQKNWIPSRLMAYYDGRALEGTTKSDSGAQIRDVVKCINKQGICPESLWPYNTAKVTTKPSAKCYTDALKNKSVKYESVAQSASALEQVLYSLRPVIFGFTVYESFESAVVAASGIVPMPAKSEAVLGGHAVLLVGYDRTKQMFLVRNSWGTGWGLAGYFWMPYAYVTSPKLASDFWVIDTMTDAG
jgi:C1A family cysteine protease